MKIPKILKIGGHKVKVCYREFSDRTAEFDTYANTISIAKGLPKSQQEAALFHEVICHALNAVVGSTEQGHALMDSLSEQLYAFLVDNRLLR